MKLHRKGVTLEGAIIAIVIFGVVLIALILLYKQIFGVAAGEFTQKECQASLLLTRAADVRAKTFCIAPVPNVVPVRCTRSFVTVEQGEVITPPAKGEPIQYTPACPDGRNECLGHNVIAKHMAQCWETFFEGEQIVFQQMQEDAITSTLSYWGPKGTACFVCSEITLRTDKDVTGFSEYVKSVKVKNQTYYDYFNSRKAWCEPRFREACWEEYAKGATTKIEQDTFKTGEKYAVVFIRQGLNACKETEDRTDSSVTFTVQTVPANDISKYCNRVIV